LGRDAEEAGGIGVDKGVEVGPGLVAEGGDEAGGVDGVLRFVGANLADGLGGEEGGIRFDHDAVIGDEAGSGLDVGGVPKGDNAGEGDERAEVEDSAGLVWGAGEAVKDEAVGGDAGGAEDGEEVVEGFTAVDDEGLGDAGIEDDAKLLVKDLELEVEGRSGVVAVEAEFAEGDAAGLGGGSEEIGPGVGFLGVERMDACGSEEVEVGELAGEGSGSEGVGGGGGDGDGAGDAGGVGGGEDVGDAASVFGKGEMAVGVDHGALRG